MNNKYLNEAKKTDKRPFIKRKYLNNKSKKYRPNTLLEHKSNQNLL